MHRDIYLLVQWTRFKNTIADNPYSAVSSFFFIFIIFRHSIVLELVFLFYWNYCSFCNLYAQKRQLKKSFSFKNMSQRKHKCYFPWIFNLCNIIRHFRWIFFFFHGVIFPFFFFILTFNPSYEHNYWILAFF